MELLILGVSIALLIAAVVRVVRFEHARKQMHTRVHEPFNPDEPFIVITMDDFNERGRRRVNQAYLDRWIWEGKALPIDTVDVDLTWNVNIMDDSK